MKTTTLDKIFSAINGGAEFSNKYFISSIEQPPKDGQKKGVKEDILQSSLKVIKGFGGARKIIQTHRNGGIGEWNFSALPVDVFFGDGWFLVEE